MLSFRRTALAALVIAATASVSFAKSEADPIIDSSVKYLVGHQNADGSWGAPGKPGEIGITGLIVKGLHESDEKDAAPAVEKAVAWLLKQQKEDGSFTEERSGLTTYRTAITVLCLCSVDRAKYAKEIDKAKKWLIDAQFEESDKVSKDSPHFGGWGYDHKGEKPDADLSNAQWAIMALKEAGVGKDDPAMKRAIEFVSRCQNNTETNKGAAEVKLEADERRRASTTARRARRPRTEIKNEDGTISYESYASMTYAGLVSRRYAGLGKDDSLKAALGWIKEHYTLEENYGLGIRAKDPAKSRERAFSTTTSRSRALHPRSGRRGRDEGRQEGVGARPPRRAQGAAEAGRLVVERGRPVDVGHPVFATGYMLNALNIAQRSTSRRSDRDPRPRTRRPGESRATCAKGERVRASHRTQRPDPDCDEVVALDLDTPGERRGERFQRSPAALASSCGPRAVTTRTCSPPAKRPSCCSGAPASLRRTPARRSTRRRTPLPATRTAARSAAETAVLSKRGSASSASPDSTLRAAAP